MAVTRNDELAAIDPHGTLHWALARPAVSDARWYPPTGYRVAYLSEHTLRVVTGDGQGDHLLSSGVAAVAPSWQPSHDFRLAYVTGAGRLVVRDADSGQVFWTAPLPARPQELAWSSDGRELLAVSATEVKVYDQTGRSIATISEPPRVPIRDAAMSPDGKSLALVRGGADQDVVLAKLTSGTPSQRRVLSGAGLAQLVWSPDGRWVLVSWPAADQWVFVQVAGKPRIAAVSRIARQFSTRASLAGFPTIEGWCCTVRGSAG